MVGLRSSLHAQRAMWRRAGRLLLSEGADKEKAKSSGYTPLLIACQEGHMEVAGDYLSKLDSARGSSSLLCLPRRRRRAGSNNTGMSAKARAPGTQ